MSTFRLGYALLFRRQHVPLKFMPAATGLPIAPANIAVVNGCVGYAKQIELFRIARTGGSASRVGIL